MVAAFLDDMTQVPNLVTIDLDDRDAGQSSALASTIDVMLETLSRTSTSATFFVTRTIAETNDRLIGRVSAAGHDVACLTTITPACRAPYCGEFRAHLQATRRAIESVTGRRVRGHRAAGFGVGFSSEWAYDVLVDEGFEYDASRFPSRHTEYGYQPVPRSVHAVRRWTGTLLEVPATTADVLAMRVPIGTASAVRGLPLPIWRRLVESRQIRGEPVVLHLRSGDLQRGGRRSVVREGRPDESEGRRTIDRMGGIIEAFPFMSVANALPELLRSAPIIES